jgi:pyruvate ferredoxin oxidoreductase beta subunit
MMAAEKTTIAAVRSPSVKDLSLHPDLLSGGHRLCAGCAESIIVRQVLLAAPAPVVVINATSCLEVATTIYPYTAWRVPWMHSLFENAAATVSGVEAAWRALTRRGKIPEERIAFIVFAGDGGTYDIGLQSLSGALERGHRFLYVCLNNEAYMNTGIQRSSATPLGAQTTTTPAGEVIPGKLQWRKDLTGIIAAHRIPYVAQTALTPQPLTDLTTKVRRALEAEGPSFLNVYSPCNRGWRFEPADTIRISQLAVESCYWPLFEVVEGEWRLTYTPREKKPVAQWLEAQGRFRHLLKPEHRHVMDEIQVWVDREWETLLARTGRPAAKRDESPPRPAPSRGPQRAEAPQTARAAQGEGEAARCPCGASSPGVQWGCLFCGRVCCPRCAYAPEGLTICARCARDLFGIAEPPALASA